MTKKALLQKFCLLAAVVASGFVLSSTSTSALSGSDFQPGNIISDAVFFDEDSMTTNQIQQFLDSKLPVCDTNHPRSGSSNDPGPPYICLKDYTQAMPARAPEDSLCNGITSTGSTKKSSAFIIYTIAQSCGVSPKVLLVLLQKEQSLVTDDWPWPIQYRSATGYGCPDTAPCDSQYYGFFNQVYNAARIYKYYAKYPNSFNHIAGRNNSIRYHPNAACGSSTVFIQNQATAGLYNYTPYRPNAAALNNLYGTGDGCSAYGNRNFWRLFNDWFGSTHASYSATYVETKYYSDSARTNEIPDIPTMRSGQVIYATARFQNSGNKDWGDYFVRLGTTGPHNRASAYASDSWFSSPARPAKLKEGIVEPGETGSFEFTLTGPQEEGDYSERFRVVAEGRTWMLGDATVRYEMTVSNPYNAEIISLKPYTDNTYTTEASTMMAKNSTVYWQLKAKNTGTQTWSQANNTRIGTDKEKNRASIFAHGSWIGTDENRPAEVEETSVAPDATGTFNFAVQTPAEGGMYRENFQLLVEGVAWMPAGTFSEDFRVFDSFDRLVKGNALLRNESIASPAAKLVLQGDGNLVIYGGGKALWSSGTNNASKLVLQGDGNLVLYSTTGRPLWASHTNNATRLIMQGDGNLVLYGSNGALWSSGTNTP